MGVSMKWEFNQGGCLIKKILGTNIRSTHRCTYLPCTPTSQCKCKLCMYNLKYMCGTKSCSHLHYSEQLLGFFRVRLLCTIAPANAGGTEGGG